MVLISASVLFLLYVVIQIRKSRIKIDFTFYWIGFGLILLLLSIFPDIASHGARIVGISNPVTFVLVLIIALLLYKVFSLSVHITKLQEKLDKLVQELALKNKEKVDSEEVEKK